MTYEEELSKCVSTISLIRAHCSAVSCTIMCLFAQVTEHCIRHADCVCACAFVCACVCSLPMPRASQTWGVKRSLRMGFSNAQAALAWQLQSGGRQKFLPHMCVSVHVRTCACVMYIFFSWINLLPFQRQFI